jgi:pantoate--beta-alanine ligase
MSSRNTYLSADARRRARALPQSLDLAAALVASGERDADVIRGRIAEHLNEVGGVEAQYVALLREGTVTPVDHVDGPTVIVIAAVIDKTRLIDNRAVG